MSISKKLRFEVFKRDGFTCVYCGKTPPDAILEVDHIEPRSKGGTDDVFNLVTCCFECNRGKKDTPLQVIPTKIQENFEILKEKELQLREYRKFARQVERRIAKDMDEIEEIFEQQFEGYSLTERFRKASLKRLLKLLPKHEVVEAMELAVAKVSDPGNAIKYFCGICWRKIKGDCLYPRK